MMVGNWRLLAEFVPQMDDMVTKQIADAVRGLDLPEGLITRLAAAASEPEVADPRMPVKDKLQVRLYISQDILPGEGQAAWGFFRLARLSETSWHEIEFYLYPEQ